MDYWYGFKPKKITIMPYGLKLDFKVNYKDYNKKINKGTMISLKKAIIALAGPLTNILIIIITIILSYFISDFKILSYTYQDIIYTNVLIALFNLLPIYPMDGGRILKEIIHIKLGLKSSYIITKKATLITTSVLSACASTLILYYKNIAIFIVMIYLWGLTIKTVKQINIKLKIHDSIKR